MEKKDMIKEVRNLIDAHWNTIYTDEYFDKDKDVYATIYDTYVNFSFRNRKELFLKPEKVKVFKKELKELLGNTKFDLKIIRMKPKWLDYAVCQIYRIIVYTQGE